MNHNKHPRDFSINPIKLCTANFASIELVALLGGKRVQAVAPCVAVGGRVLTHDHLLVCRLVLAPREDDRGHWLAELVDTQTGAFSDIGNQTYSSTIH